MESIINKFYKAFQNLDAERMAECYHGDIVFEDPAFGVLKGERASNMWRMLCDSQKGKDFKLIYSNVKADENTGSALWEAFYTFSKTGRKIHNPVQAQFKFKDGKIINHMDSFDLYKWSKQALGYKGAVLGKTLFFKNKVRYNTSKMLDEFEKSVINDAQKTVADT